MKKFLVSIIMAASIMALVGCGELSKVNKAIENNDLATVAEYYGQLKEEDKAQVSEKMRLYCQNLSASYTDENIDYESVKADFDLLDQEVLSNDTSFDGIQQSVELLHTSREAYKAGNDFFSSGEFEKALVEYEKVLPSDSHIEDVNKNIEECKKQLLPDVVGTWMNAFDIGPAMATMMGRANDERIKLEVVTFYEFKEDGTGRKYADTEQMKKNFDEYMTALIEIIVEQYQTQYGISKEQLDKEFKTQYGMNMTDYLRKYSNVDSIMQSMEYSDLEFTYNVDGKDVLVTGTDGKTVNFEREGEELLLKSEVAEENIQLVELFQIEYPMHFTKVE